MAVKKYVNYDLGVMDVLEQYNKDNINALGCSFVRNCNEVTLKHRHIFDYNSYKNRKFTYTISGGYKTCK